jgi:hypothetical protein
MALRGFVKCLADGHNYANTLLSTAGRAGRQSKRLASVPLALLRRPVVDNDGHLFAFGR